MPDKLYTLQEVAEILRIKDTTAKRLIIKRELAATIVGKLYRVTETQLQEYLNKQTIQSK